MRLEEQDFNDRGVSSLDESKKFSYTIGKESCSPSTCDRGVSPLALQGMITNAHCPAGHIQGRLSEARRPSSSSFCLGLPLAECIRSPKVCLRFHSQQAGHCESRRLWPRSGRCIPLEGDCLPALPSSLSHVEAGAHRSPKLSAVPTLRSIISFETFAPWASVGVDNYFTAS